MQLSALLNSYNIPLTKAERSFFAGLSTDGSRRSDAYYEQQVKQLAETKEALRQLPDQKSSERQNRTEKMKMLKERLKMLKQMIPFMSASAAKALKAELQQIAAQIGALKDGSGGSPLGALSDATAAPAAAMETSGDMSAPVSGDTTAGGVTEDAEPVSDTTVESGDQGGKAEADEASDTSKNTEEAAKDTSALDQAKQNSAESAADRAEKEELDKLKQLYEAVKQALERKLQKPDDPVTQAALQLQAYQEAAATLAGGSISVAG